MPTVPLPEQPDLGQLRTRARELQRAARTGDAAALTLISEHLPAVRVGADFPLSGAQTALARHYGFTSWARLRKHVEVINARSWVLPAPAPDEPLAHRFLRLACLTYTEDGPARRTEAAELLTAHPELPGSDLAVAAACADAPALRRLLETRPAGARCGPFGWSPLMYLAYARHDPGVRPQATLDTVELLLAAGADPNDGRFFLGLPTPFTVLTGVFGNDSGDEPAHPQAIPLARALLRAGADPNDGQTLYNRMFGLGDDHLVVLFEYGLGRDSNGPWHRLLGDQLWSPREMLANLLAWAVIHDQRERVALLHANGVDVHAPLPARWHRGPVTPLELALTNGHTALAEQLRGYGAAPPRLSTVDSFVAAVLAGDGVTVHSTPSTVVEQARRERPGLVVWAAAQGRISSLELLLDSGFDVNAYGRSDTPIEQPWHSALHAAAERDNVALARWLLAHGADPTRRDARFDATPVGWAQHLNHPAVAEFLAQFPDS